MESSSDEENSKSKLRISLHLAPGVKSHNSDGTPLEIPSDPIAVPCDIRKRGLSAVVNHLLGRNVVQESDQEEQESDEEDDNLPPISFDFLLSSKLLRLPLESAVRKEGLSTEKAIDIYYFPARLPPVKEGEGENVPDWITSMDYCRNESNGVLFAGCADGVVRSFSCGGDSIQSMSTVAAHTGQIHCLTTVKFGQADDSPVLVATGSMDQTLVTHLYNSDNKHKSSLDLHAVYSGGHGNSIGSVAVCTNGNDVVMASGDWDGGLVLWNVPSLSSSEDDEAQESSSKRQKGSSKKHAAPKSSIREVKPKTSTKAHTSNISGLSFGYQAPNTLLTSSWDHSLKVYDVERMDCVLTTNGSRVITSMSRCMNGNIVGTGCADNMVRLWDMRVGNGSGVGSMGQIADKTLRQR